ncbi:hypothetical protein BT93_H1081 [Corymbia citriodora subsp. variegata]|nr:hypothetical protein BT93_H1081 [Corymbia citriodora subsp. variegata]
MAVTEEAKGRDGPDFSALPEGCIARVVSLTSPADACRLASVSPNFKSACDSDAVWASFLPTDCCQMVSRNVSSLKSSTSASAMTRFSSAMARWYSGKKCIMLSARALSIACGDTPKCWSWNPMPAPEVAELIRVWWLEIRGTISSCMLPKERRDEWLEIELGEFLMKDGEDGEIEMSDLEMKGCHKKGGLVVEGIEIRPKDGKEQCLYAGHM